MVLFYDGTGDAGDSITHYLISRYAWAHPELLLDHWGKPFFTLLSSPFAQFGIIGIKFFNVLMTTASLFFTVQTAQVLIPNHSQKWYDSPLWLTAFYLAAPLPFVLTFSGLTEPLFAALLSAGLYFLVVKNKWEIAAILISFLPFVRSEGLIILGVWGVYLLSKFIFKNKKVEQSYSFQQLIKAGWLLGVGHLLYAIVGVVFKGDVFWVFNEIPYAQIEKAYGSGDLLHFAVQLTYILGIPIYIFLLIGMIGGVTQLFHLKKEKFHLEKIVLIGGGFLAFFTAHSLFWYFGIFKSMGLNRVFVGIMPLMAMMAFYGYRMLTKGLNKINTNNVFKSSLVCDVLIGVFLFYVLIFPFTSNPAAVKWEHDLSLLPEQILLKEVAAFLEKNQLDTHHTIYYAHPYLAVTLGIDPFTEKYHLLDQFQLKKMSANNIVVWDNWFAPIDKNITRADLLEKLPLQLLQRFEVKGKREVVFEIYKSVKE